MIKNDKTFYNTLKKESFYDQFKKKRVAVLNEKVQSGKVMNALAHMCIGFGSKMGSKDLRLTDYRDFDGKSHSHISHIS